MTSIRTLSDTELIAILTDDNPVSDETLEMAGNEAEHRKLTIPR